MTLPLILMQKSEKNRDHSPLIRPISLLAGVVQNTYSSFSSGVKDTTGLYLNLIGIKKNNIELKNENAKLKTELNQLQELKLENERLNKMLGFQQKTSHDLLPAKIIGRDLFSEQDTLTINRGTQNGVKNSMAIITHDGVVGYVLRADLFSSQIILLTDRYAAIDAHVQRTRARGIVEGKTKDHCLLNYLRREDDVKIGDIIVTSGLNHVFPKGIPVGTVQDVKKSQYGISQVVEIVPAVSVSQLEEVFIVLNLAKEDPQENSNTDTTTQIKKKSEVGS